MSCDDERPTIVEVLEIVVECGGYVTVWYANKCSIDIAVFLKDFRPVFHAGLAIEWDKQVCGFLKHARLDRVLDINASQHLSVVELQG